MTVIYLIDSAGVLAGPVALPIIPGIGMQIPGNAVEVVEKLPEPDVGYVLAFIGDEITAITDHRGPVYLTSTGAQEEWTKLGDLPDGYTTEPRPSALHVWHDGGWQLDEAALSAFKANEVLAIRDDLLRLAAMHIAPLQDAYDLNESTDFEEALLMGWKRYRIALSRIEQQEGYPINIEWPPVPGSQES